MCVATDKVGISIRYVLVLMCYFVGIYVIESWTESVGPTRIQDGLRPTCLLHRWTKPTHQTKNLGGNLTRFSNRYRYRYRFSKH